MNRLSDQLQSMFDMIGMPVFVPGKTQPGKTMTPKTVTSKTKTHPLKTKSKSNSKTQTKSSPTAVRSKSSSTSGSLQSIKSQVSPCKKSHDSRPSANSPQQAVRPHETVFAPRLLHSGSLTADDTSDRMTVESMAANKYHCAVYFIHCAQHQRVALSKPSKHQALWMPFMPIPNNRSWTDASLAGLLIILSGANMDLFLSLKDNLPFSEKHLMELFDVQLPQTQNIITRLTWYVRLDQSKMAKTSAHYKCCQETDSLVWIAEKDILEQGQVLEYLWGSELLVHYKTVTAAYQNGMTPQCSSYEEYNLEMAFQFVPRNPPVTLEQQLLSSSNLSENDIERLYIDFLEHCFPCTAMTMHSFKVYLYKYGVKYEDRLESYFRAFNYTNNGSITFPELLMGLACLDGNSIHNETRCKFIVRYYGVRNRGYLSENELRLMIQDMQIGISNAEIDQQLAKILTDIETEPDPTSPGKVRIQYHKFIVGVGNLKIRGTSKLCRIHRPIFEVIINVILVRMKRRDTKKSRQYANVIEQPYTGICLGCKAKQPTLDEHLYKLDVDGYYVGRKKPGQLKHLRTSSKPHDRKAKKDDSKTKAQKSTQKPSMQPSSSIEVLSPQPTESNRPTTKVPKDDEHFSVAFKLIKLIRNFEPNKGTTLQPNGLLAGTIQERESFLKMLEALELKLSPMLKSRCVQVASPVYLMGDIHGNLSDLLSLEKAFWKRAPIVGPNLVFLGDMVDRGKWSVECVAYLMALKVLMPFKVTLLRGNHEIRTVQRLYSYHTECIDKYGDDHGTRLWELTNRIFDQLPLCAIIDEAIYCAHGGIPQTTVDLHEVATLPTQIPDPEHECQIAWEILWSDPIHQQHFLQAARFMQVDLEQCHGYLPNKKRGTAFAFNEEATDRFLATNGLSHVVRAHEVPPKGFCFHFGKKCITIFSCSHYCGNCNEAAVLLVVKDQIRIIRVDTTNNASATDPPVGMALNMPH